MPVILPLHVYCDGDCENNDGDTRPGKTLHPSAAFDNLRIAPLHSALTLEFLGRFLFSVLVSRKVVILRLEDLLGKCNSTLGGRACRKRDLMSGRTSVPAIPWIGDAWPCQEMRFLIGVGNEMTPLGLNLLSIVQSC